MRLLEKLKAQSPLVLDGGLATTLEQAGCSLKTSLWSSEVLKITLHKLNKYIKHLRMWGQTYCLQVRIKRVTKLFLILG